MALNKQKNKQVLRALYTAFPEDMHIARLLIRDLQQEGNLDKASDIALEIARRMVSKGKADHASGFLAICTQLGHEDTVEIEMLSSLARFSGDSDAGAESNNVQSFTLIDQLSDQEALDFLHRGRLYSVEKGTEVVRQGEVENTFHLILDGAMRVEMDTAAGHHVELGSLETGHFFGEVACVYRLPRSATVTSTEPSLILEFSALAISQLMQRSPLAGESLLHVIQTRMISAMSHSHPALESLPENDRQWLAEESRLLELKDKEVIARQSEMENEWYILVHGEADTRTLRANGEAVTVPLKSGAIFGGMDSNIGLPPHSEVTATSRCLVCCVPKEIFCSFINVYDGFERWINHQGKERLEQWKQVISEKSSGATE